MVRIDETNHHILRLLQKNARMSMTDLAAAVGRSESTVRERVVSLELAGLVRGYQAQVDWSQAGLPTLAVIRAGCDPGRAHEVARTLASIPTVTRAVLTTGPRPVLATLRVRGMDHLQSILRERLTSGELRDIETQVALESLVERRPPVLVSPEEGRLAAGAL